MTTATAMRPGVRYRETRNSDGTANFHSVPLMGTLKAGARGNAKSVGREWMAAALEAAKADAARGYLAPLKPTHADGVPYVCGYVLPTHIADDQYDGEDMPTLFGDFIAVEPATAERLRRGEWPFRSVEIVDWSAPRVNAVALLAADAPHFRFPLFAGTLLDDAMPGRFCAAKLAAFGDETDPRESAAAEAAEASKLDAILRFLVALGRKLGMGGDAEGDPEKDAVAQPVNDRPADEPGSDGADASAEGEDAPPEKNEDPAAKGADASADEGDDEEENDMPKDDKPENLAAKAGASLAAMTAERDGLATKLAAAEKSVGELTAKLSAAESKLTEIETAAKREKDITEAETKLKAKKIVLPTNFRDLAAKMHAGSPEAFASFVETFAVNPLSTDPDRHFGGGATAGDKSVTDAVAKFAAGKPVGTYERAQSAAEKWIEHRRVVPSSPVTLAEWLHTHAGAAGR